LPADVADAAAAVAEAALLFGRGLRAGVDRREQKKASANHEADLLRKARPRFLLRRVPWAAVVAHHTLHLYHHLNLEAFASLMMAYRADVLDAPHIKVYWAVAGAGGAGHQGHGRGPAA
jgi:hypothetical protein